MVKKGVDSRNTSPGVKAEGKLLDTCTRISLHTIVTDEAIEAICHKVMKLVEGSAPLLRITPERLERLQKAVKKKVGRHVPLPELSPDDGYAQRAKLGIDWDFGSWKAHPPHGGVWTEKTELSGNEEEDEEQIIALIYETELHPGEYEMYIDRKYYDKPQTALDLILDMKKRHKALMAWDKKQKKKKKKGGK